MAINIGSLAAIGTSGIIGAVVAKTGEEVSTRIGYLNPLKILNAIMPQSVNESLKKGVLNKTLEICNTKVAELFNSYKLSSVFGAPFIEEAVFRAGIQEILTLALGYAMDPQSAQIASIALTNTIFAMAHDKDLDSVACLDLWLKSAAFGISYKQGGYLAAVAAHMINNLRQNYVPPLSKLYSPTSGVEDFAMIVARNRQIAPG